ncbi:unnamed protein product [Ceratitis capitata]|uniref:(Mediterranean fruit fly) hypothetical protein n=1 Tax=Ceratitis capitata TaxID=7213 RepID=A0A811V016_CERCA|nr:unnamed protein product [Ceratitis capitata]
MKKNEQKTGNQTNDVQTGEVTLLRRVGPLSVGVGKERLRARQQDSEAARQQTTAEPSLLDKRKSLKEIASVVQQKCNYPLLISTALRPKRFGEREGINGADKMAKLVEARPAV